MYNFTVWFIECIRIHVMKGAEGEEKKKGA